ncbi:hypothetical protein IFR05_013260 [Cadophora sp. M221]|nr:hypothetical protein IFR05_013260 [Cadophora sp. M221]
MMEMDKPSRYKPLKTDEAWDRLVQASENIEVLGELSDVDAQRSLEAVDTLKMVTMEAHKPLQSKSIPNTVVLV